MSQEPGRIINKAEIFYKDGNTETLTWKPNEAPPDKVRDPSEDVIKIEIYTIKLRTIYDFDFEVPNGKHELLLCGVAGSDKEGIWVIIKDRKINKVFKRQEYQTPQSVVRFNE